MELAEPEGMQAGDKPEQPTISVSVQTLSGVCVQRRVPLECTLQTLAAAVEEELKMPFWSQRFSLAGCIFGDETETLSALGIHDAVVLDVVRSRPSMLEHRHFDSVEVRRYHLKVPVYMKVEKHMGDSSFVSMFKAKILDAEHEYVILHRAACFDGLRHAQELLMEIRLMQHFNHDNILQILDILPPLDVDFQDLYYITEYMPTDLRRVIRSAQTLSNDHFLYFIWQLSRGVRHLHSASVVHCSLSPDRILLNAQCDLKIRDFRYARRSGQPYPQNDLDAFEVCRWYRCPERLLDTGSLCAEAWDVWAVGCILCEMLGREPLFPGKDHADQIKTCVQVLGKPSREDLADLTGHPSARRFVQELPECDRITWRNRFPDVLPELLHCADALLHWHPAQRMRLDDLLAWDCFQDLHDGNNFFDESCVLFNWPRPGAEEEDIHSVRTAVYHESAALRPDLLKRDHDRLTDRGMLLK
eukprot:TRINITY_DN28565_c0_g1_i1.p1 TRINITY_DN28565_c0_g1~~TRINITY_DN28565_c0_g1_i1.p1  ORF type:complete len:482 (-),score=61.46 TRINITY_DN28565_c0_g1_i1:123-1538(-)